MKKLYHLFFILLILTKGTISFSQTFNATTYPFSTASGVALEDMSTGTTLLVGADSDDGASALTSMGGGFTFYYVGIPYTQFAASANGYIKLGTTVNSPAAAADYTNSLASANQNPAIAPYWDDLYTGVTTGKVHFKLIGTAPNRKLVVEWYNMQIPRVAAATAGTGVFQLWLSETTGKIDFVYGAGVALNTANSGASIGINKSASLFASVTASTGTVSYAAANNANTAAITSGTNYTFTALGVTAAPVTPTFTNISPSTMDLNWVDNSNNETFFNVKRSLSSSGPFVQLATIPSTTTAGTGTVYTFSNTVLTSSTTYYYQIESANEGSPPSLLTANQATTAAGNVISTPAGGLWSNTSTWVGGAVPASTDIVTIANGATVTIDAAANAYSLTVGQGASATLLFEPTTARTLTVAADIIVMNNASFTSGSGALTTHSIIAGGNLTNNGILDLASGTSGAGLSFNGGANSTFSGTGATTNLYTLTGAKSALAQVIELNLSNFSVRGLSIAATGALLTSNTGTGTIKFSGTNTFSGQLWSVAGYTIPATLGIWINNPNFTVTGLAGSPVLAGLFRMTTGTYNIGTATENSMGFNTGSNITVEGGAINATGRFGVAAATNVISYTQTAGTITVCTIGNASGTLGSFDLGTSVSSAITISGGIIINQISATIDYRNQAGAGIAGVTGGTLQLGNAASGAAKVFSIRGVAPNLVLSNTSANHTASFGTAVSYNNSSLNITINTGNILNLANAVFLFNGTTLTNNGTLTHTGASSILYFFNTVPILYTGTGVVTAPMTNFAMQTTSTVTIDPASPNIVAAAVRMFSGNIINANKITIGNGGATSGIIQVGNTTTPTTAGTFDVAPTFNPGTAGMIISFLRTASVSRTIGNEIPASRILTTLSVDENDPTHSLILAGGNLTISSGTTPTFSFTNGKINLNGSSITLGLNGTTAALAGAMTTGATSYMYNGQFKRWISATTGNRDFPMGTAAAKKALSINYTTVPTAAGTLTANWSSVAPSFPNAVPLTEGANFVNAISRNGSWFVDAADGLAGGAYTTTVTANGTTDVTDYTKAVLVKRPSTGGDWTLDGTPVANSGSNAAPVLSRTGMSGFSEFAIGGQSNVSLPISLEYFRGTKQAAVNVLDWKVNSSSASTLTLERSTDRVNYKAINTQTATVDRMLTPFTYTDAAPAAGVNYYRLKITNADGESKYSNVVALINKEKGFELISVVPNPVQSNTVLSLSSAKAGKIELAVSDAMGKVVMKQSISVIAGNNPITLNFTTLAAGTYQITVINADGDAKSTRFVKF
jgi:hypothetical protein